MTATSCCSASTSEPATMKTWFDDLTVGDRMTAEGRYAVKREETIAFAQAYDPQLFHLDDAAAEANPVFGRLAASGWHTAAIIGRLTIDHCMQLGLQTLAGGGVDQLRWLAPVYPGDTLSAEVVITELKPSRSKPDRGAVICRATGYNQHGEAVITMLISSIVARQVAD